jgi:hypothetical protein
MRNKKYSSGTQLFFLSELPKKFLSLTFVIHLLQ